MIGTKVGARKIASFDEISGWEVEQLFDSKFGVGVENVVRGTHPIPMLHRVRWFSSRVEISVCTIETQTIVGLGNLALRKQTDRQN